MFCCASQWLACLLQYIYKEKATGHPPTCGWFDLKAGTRLKARRRH
jgi:hypothetical protein